LPAPTTEWKKTRDIAWKSENLNRFRVALSLYDVVVSGVRYREDGWRDGC
jgi:hypothetical protein